MKTKPAVCRRRRFLGVQFSAALFLLAGISSSSATTRYVWQSSPSPAPPYTSWATAAQTIQQAVDAAVAGDEIVVTNGNYATGGRAVFGLMTNRLAVTKPLVVRSVNGPEWTVIQGYQVPGTTNGDGAVRCVYLTNGASLSGFTLTHGATHQATGWEQEDCGGGVWCESVTAVLTNCVLAGNSTDGAGGGAYRGTLNDCMLLGNSALGNNSYGGGVGGGASGANLSRCTLTGNTAKQSGGGTVGGTLNNCTLRGNWAGSEGGGGNYSVLNNCSLSSNTTPGNGGGAYGGTLNNCTLTGNSAGETGGGACGGALHNCTVTGNSAGGAGGGASYDCTLTNCIVYFNTATVGANYSQSTKLNFCCTTPLPFAGLGNIALDPQLASDSHLSAGSPCRGAGSAAYTTGTDIDGEAWANPPSIGCDEYQAGAFTGPLAVSITATFTNVATGYAVGLTALIDGRTTASVWDLAEGTVISNRPYATHAWTTPGEYAVVLRAYNDTYPAGVGTTQMIHVVAQPVHHVAADSYNPVPPYDSWTTAAGSMQDAVDAATVTGALVLVSNGVYAAGQRRVGTLANRLAVHKPLVVRSVNGPQDTVIEGYQLPGATNGNSAIRCVYLTNGASLSGFTLTNGATADTASFSDRENYGGGAWCEPGAVISNCVIVGNSAQQLGGGAYRGTLNNCILARNTVPGSSAAGGGAYQATLNDCTVSNNSVRLTGGFGGGVASSELERCTLVANRSGGSGGGASMSILNNCTLTGNSTLYGGGGGAFLCILNNCILTQNSAPGTTLSEGGGGASGSTLYNCVLSRNTAATRGGGGVQCDLCNCTITGNSAPAGGGLYLSGGTVRDCVVYYNTASSGANYYIDPDPGWGTSTFAYCCTTPLPAGGVFNITAAPRLVDYLNGNVRLQSDSPCINAARNAYAPGSTDLDGNPRIVSGTVDIGAYEYQGAGSTISYAWLQQYGLPTDGSADATDPDADGHNTWQEWRCLTDPTNAASVLKLHAPAYAPPGVRLRWSSDAGHTYAVERATRLTPPVTFTLLQTNVAGLFPTTDFTDRSAPLAGAAFYRIRADATNPSVPLVLEPPAFVPANVTVTWNSVANRTYTLERSTDPAQTFWLVQSNVVGQPGTTSFTDTNAAGPRFFYRVSVQP